MSNTSTKSGATQPGFNSDQLEAMFLQISFLADLCGDFAMAMLERPGGDKLSTEVHMLRASLEQIGAIADSGCSTPNIGSYADWFMGSEFKKLGKSTTAEGRGAQ